MLRFEVQHAGLSRSTWPTSRACTALLHLSANSIVSLFAVLVLANLALSVQLIACVRAEAARKHSRDKAQAHLPVSFTSTPSRTPRAGAALHGSSGTPWDGESMTTSTRARVHLDLQDICQLDKDISHRTPGFKFEPTLEDKVHCVCFVVPCQSATDDSYMQRLQELRDIVRSRSKPL